MSTGNQLNIVASETGARVNAAAEWRSRLAAITGGLLLFLSISGLVIYLVPFNAFSQLSVLGHTLVGLAMLVPVTWYTIRHWRVRRRGKLSHYQLLGYMSVAMLLACVVSEFVVTWQGVIGPRMSYAWDLIHLITGLAMGAFIIVHLATVIVRRVNNPDALRLLRGARRAFYIRSIVTGGVPLVLCAVGRESTPIHNSDKGFRTATTGGSAKIVPSRPAWQVSISQTGRIRYRIACYKLWETNLDRRTWPRSKGSSASRSVSSLR